METPLTIEMNIRKANLNKLIYDSRHNDNISTDDVIKLFSLAYVELEHYKYFGSNIKVKEFLDNEISTDEHGLKSFLESTSDGYTIYQIILSRLV